MIRQGRTTANDVSHTCDVVIVGSGAGGAPLAAELAMAGLEVVVLDKGPFVTATDMTQDWGTTLPLFEGRHGVGAPRDFGANLSYAEVLGGSTVHYWACSFTPPPERIALWNSEFGLGLDYERDLDPLLTRVQNNLSVHRTHDYLFNANNRLIRLGTQLMRDHSGDPRYRGENTPQAVKSCIGCGFREVGCAYNRKQSQLISYIPMASRAGAVFFSDCEVSNIIVQNGRAVGVSGFFRFPRDSGPQGPAVKITARQAVVVACNGLTSPELLLRAGLSNKNIGRNLVINPNIFVWAESPVEMNFRHGPPESWWVTGFADVRRDSAGRYLDGGWKAIPDLRDVSTAAALSGVAGDELRGRLIDFKRLVSAISSVDDDNHPDNAVTLDSNGDWQADYSLRGDDGPKALDYLRKVARIYFAAGCQRVWIPWGDRVIEAASTFAQTEARIDALVDSLSAGEAGDLVFGGAHLLSTARIGQDPANSVCGPDHQAHELDGLYIAGGASVPTSVGRDPSITIITLSTLLARQLLKARGKDLVRLSWERTRKNHTQIVAGPPAALGYDPEQRAVASKREPTQTSRPATDGTTGIPPQPLRFALPATPRTTRFGLPPESSDYQLEHAHAKADNSHATIGSEVHLEVTGLRPQAAEGQVDLTIYGPKRRLPSSYRPPYPPDPDLYAVIVEATLDVDTAGRARHAFRSVRADIPGTYIAVFRRTDFSSRPIARCAFELGFRRPVRREALTVQRISAPR